MYTIFLVFSLVPVQGLEFAIDFWQTLPVCRLFLSTKSAELFLCPLTVANSSQATPVLEMNLNQPTEKNRTLKKFGGSDPFGVPTSNFFFQLQQNEEDYSPYHQFDINTYWNDDHHCLVVVRKLDESGWTEKLRLIVYHNSEEIGEVEIGPSSVHEYQFVWTTELRVEQKMLTYFQQIPKLIFQTWHTTQVSPSMKNAVESVLTKNPEYKYQLFTDQECLEFVQTHFDARVVQAYECLFPGAFKADLWRYCVLYVHGGIYLDIKSVTCLPFSAIIRPHDEFVSVKDRPVGSIFNGFMAVIPNHPMIKSIIEYCVQNVERKDYGEDCLDVTGPKAVGKAMNQYLNRERFSPFAVGEYTINSTKLHLLEHCAEGGKVISSTNLPCFFTKYPEYNEERNAIGLCQHYALCYRSKKVFQN